GTNGDGGILNLTASNAPTSPKTEGILAISGSLNVDGVGDGAGGKVNLRVNSATTFAVAPAVSGNGVNGIISARAGDISGAGGTITIGNSGTGGVSLATTAIPGDRAVTPAIDVSASAGGGAGGVIRLTSDGGPISLPGGTLPVVAVGSFNGGTLELNGTALSVTGARPLTLDASGSASGSGAGGSVNVVTSGREADLVVG